MAILTDEIGYKVVEFGTGDILMNDVMLGTEHCNALAFKQMDEGREIGSTTQEFAGTDWNEFNPQVVFIFNKKASVRALMDSLQEIHDQMPEDTD